MAIKGARMVNNIGKQLNLGEDAYFTFDTTDIPRAQELREWYDSLKNKDQIKNINSHLVVGMSDGEL